MEQIEKLVSGVPIPKLVKVRQRFERPILNDVVKAVLSELEKPNIITRIKPGMNIAITGGSRGIANMALVIRTIAEFLKEKGALPFIVPAMGSHGGATAHGQTEILAGYGITEEYCGCPIRATMETVKVGVTEEGYPVYMDKFAAEADGVIVVNRVKAHTAFRGPYESGIMKMITIGLGKQKGAESCHRAGFDKMARTIPLFAKIAIANTNLSFAVALIDNGFEETCMIRAIPIEDVEREEPSLLQYANSLMAKILLPETDVLIVDKIGKNISGDGMDPNVTGVFTTPYASGGIRSQRVAVLDVTEESHGNAAGLGMADVTTRRAYEKMSFETTYANVVTSTVLNAARIPAVFDNDRQAMRVAIKCCYDVKWEDVRIVRIRNSLELTEIYVSESLLDEVLKNPALEILGEPEENIFDENGNLFPF